MKAIIFDCDGTLVDSEMTHYLAWAHVLKKQGYLFTLEEYSHFVGSPIDHTAHTLALKIGKNCAEELTRDKQAFFSLQIQERVTPVKETLAFLHKLIGEQKRLKYKLAIASGASREDILIYLHHLKIERVFDLVLSGKDDLSHYHDPEGNNKPKPYIYLEAAKQLGLNPSDCIVIEDSYTGVTASAKAGCATVAIPTSFSLNHDFSASHLLIPSLHSYTVDQFLSDVANCANRLKSRANDYYQLCPVGDRNQNL